MHLGFTDAWQSPADHAGIYFLFAQDDEAALVASLEARGVDLPRFRRDKLFLGKARERLGLPSEPGVVVLCGLGARVDFGPGASAGVGAERLREAAGLAGRLLGERGFPHAVAFVPQTVQTALGPRAAAKVITEGFVLGQYHQRWEKTEEQDEFTPCRTFTLAGLPRADHAESRHGARAGLTVGRAVYQARDWAGRSCNLCTSEMLAQEAVAYLRGPKLTARALGRRELQALGMGAFLGVNQGSASEPRLVVAEYRGGPRGAPPVGLVGKGITFDTGGYSLKLANEMWLMKDDMAGAAAVCCAIRAACDLALPVNVVGVCPLTDNAIDAHAQKPGDIVATMSGRTVEVQNTDAEGRLILCDALTYVGRFQPACVLDIATLTGGVVVALGKVAMGLFSNHAQLLTKVQRACESSGERGWHLPLYGEYFEQMKSEFADLANIAGERGAAPASTAAAFLETFAHRYRWAHLDIAGVCWQPKDQPYTPHGPTGVGVRLLVDFLDQYDGRFTDEAPPPGTRAGPDLSAAPSAAPARRAGSRSPGPAGRKPRPRRPARAPR